MGVDPQLVVAGSATDPVLKVSGEFDRSAEGSFMTAVEGVLERAHTLTIDMRGATFVDSSAVRGLLATQKQAMDAGVRMLLVDGEALKRVLGRLGILNTFNRVDGDGRALA
jgi:anti-anti-sigma factor